MSIADFTVKERLRFRKLLEVAYSTTFPGEREAALAAAERLAAAHGLSLREAAGLRDPVSVRAEPRPRDREPRARRPGFPADFGAAGPEAMGRWWMRRPPAGAAAVSEAERTAADKKRHDAAMADAIARGLDAEERAAEERAARARANRGEIKRNRPGAWRARSEFVRVLLTETGMNAREIAAVAGVSIYDVFREKLLMRRPRAA